MEQKTAEWHQWWNVVFEFGANVCVTETDYFLDQKIICLLRSCWSCEMVIWTTIADFKRFENHLFLYKKNVQFEPVDQRALGHEKHEREPGRAS